MRLTRSAMLDVLGTEYVKLARIKGLPERQVIWKHAFKNAALPVVTFAALLFVALLNGSIIVETVFGWPGLGLLVIEAVDSRDYPVVQAVVLVPERHVHRRSTCSSTSSTRTSIPGSGTRHDRTASGHWPMTGPSTGRAAIRPGRPPTTALDRGDVCSWSVRIFAPLLAPHSPAEGSLGERLRPPLGHGRLEPDICSAPIGWAATR